MTESFLDPFFKPRSIAIVGASANADKIGGRPIRYLNMSGYCGRVLPINPERSTVQGLPAFASIADVDGEINLAIIAVPSASVPDAVRACVAKGVKAAAIFSAGFAEADAAGEARQAEIVADAAAGDMRLLGPNCMGTINTRNGTIATFTSGIVDKLPKQGGISLASQSGALGAHCFVLAGDRGLGLNLWATTGNQADVDIADFLAYMADDPQTEVILGCLEGVRNPDRLIEAFEIARRNRKPMVLLKVGRSEVGALAAASHTASLAGSDDVFDAILRQHHVHRARSVDELFDIAYACSFARYPRNRNLGLLTLSGGAGILMADAAQDFGLEIPPLPDAAQARMKALIPFSGTRNPVDVTAQMINNPGLVEPMFDALLADDIYGSAIVFFAHVGRNEAIISQVIPGLQNVARANADRFLAISSLTTPAVREAFEASGFAVFEDPTRAVAAVAALARFRESFETVGDETSDCLPNEPASPMSLFAGQVLSEHESRRVLEAAGVPVAKDALVNSAANAAATARGFGYPVVMKIVSKTIPHKSEIGGVILDIPDDAAASKAFETLMARGAAAVPAEQIDGVLVTPMIKGGVEMILGTSRDPVFGPIVMVGIGGIFVEVFKDVAFGKAPLNERQAAGMIRSLKGHALLKGARGQPVADEAALVDALVKLSRLATDNADTIDSIDINPLVALPEGEGVVALDALVTTTAIAET